MKLTKQQLKKIIQNSVLKEVNSYDTYWDDLKDDVLCLKIPLPIKYGDSGIAVETVQNMLESHGYILDQYGVDSMFGSETETAVLAFQQQNGINPTGQVNQETLEYVFTEAGIYSSILTVTDNDGAKSTWQTSIIVTQKEVNTNNQQTGDEVNPLIIGGGMAGVLALGGYGALRYLRTEDEDDFFDFGEPEAVNLSCPSCGGLISITTTQRPIQVGCPMCQGQFIVRE